MGTEVSPLRRRRRIVGGAVAALVLASGAAMRPRWVAIFGDASTLGGGSGMTWRRKILWVGASVLTTLVAWVAAPVDLMPSWLSSGSYDRSGRGSFETPTHVTVPEDLVRDVVGLLLADAKGQLRQRGLQVYVHDISLGNNGYISSLMVEPDGVLLTVFLGRVVKAERPATI